MAELTTPSPEFNILVDENGEALTDDLPITSYEVILTNFVYVED